VQTELRTRELEGEVTSLARAQELSQQSYVSGVIPLTDVLDSDRLLLTAPTIWPQSRATMQGRPCGCFARSAGLVGLRRSS